MQEIWRDNKDYEGLYQVSNLRRVKSLNYNRTGKERAIKKKKNKGGYLWVWLHKDGEKKHCLVHRLVVQAFIPNPDGLPQVNHIDEDKTNNCIENLEWCSQKYNNLFGTRIERFIKSVNKPVMCVETSEIFSSSKEAQDKTGIFATSITACAKHRKGHYTAGRCHWEYVKKGEIL